MILIELNPFDFITHDCSKTVQIYETCNTEKNDTTYFQGKWLQSIYFSYI